MLASDRYGPTGTGPTGIRPMPSLYRPTIAPTGDRRLMSQKGRLDVLEGYVLEGSLRKDPPSRAASSPTADSIRRRQYPPAQAFTRRPVPRGAGPRRTGRYVNRDIRHPLRVQYYVAFAPPSPEPSRSASSEGLSPEDPSEEGGASDASGSDASGSDGAGPL